MKKVLVVALMLGAGLAYASSMGVPWFVDNAAAGSWPPAGIGTVGNIFVHNNDSAELEVTIEYYNQAGSYIGPFTNNTFVLAPNGSLAFRPVLDDALYESAEARLIPNRPRTSIPPGDFKKNGSIVFRWLGDGTLLSGKYVEDMNSDNAVSGTDPTVIYKLSGHGHLLPPGS